MLALGCALFGAEQLPGLAVHAGEGERFLTPASIVVANDRLVCSLLGSEKTAVHIVGQDSGASAVADGAVYWTFGDTVTDGPGFLPNVVGRSDDTDASDCITIVPKQAQGWPVSLLAPTEGELLVWPVGMASVRPGTMHFFYDSVAAGGPLGWRVVGIGLGSFDTATMTGTRLLGGALLWSDATGFPARDARAFVDDAYLYVLLAAPPDGAATGVILVRVAREAVESPGEYEYWQPADGATPGHWVANLWDGSAAKWRAEVAQIRPLWVQAGGHNGVEVAYNEFLGKWLAVYTTEGMTKVTGRTADALTGPWDASDAVIINCPLFHPGASLFDCYSGAQHQSFAKDGGRTIYITYSNHETYQVYLHEVRLAAPITQWADDQARAVYVAGKNPAPEGFISQGVAFYASDIAAPGLAPIHQWQSDDGTIRYGPSAPGSAYKDAGIAFYAPATITAARATNAPYAPVFRWTKDGLERYSPLDLANAGYSRRELAFFAACPDADHDGVDDCSASYPPCPDFTGDRVVNVADMTYAVTHYRAPKPRGGIFTVSDMTAVIRQFREVCPD